MIVVIAYSLIRFFLIHKLKQLNVSVSESSSLMLENNIFSHYIFLNNYALKNHISKIAVNLNCMTFKTDHVAKISLLFCLSFIVCHVL